MPPMTLIVDLRCLQNIHYRNRGIGNHALGLIRSLHGRFTGLVDPALPPLSAHVRAMAMDITTHAYVPGARMLLNPSPLTADQSFLARLLTDPRVRKCACVHDFIPLDEPRTYLRDPAIRLDYYNALVWLRRYDMYLPNSAPTAARLRELLGPVPLAITGVALPDWVFGISPVKPRHILMIGGGDPRKNAQWLLRARALRPGLRALPVVITGAYGADEAASLRAYGGVALPGQVSNEALRELYAHAYAVVTPSRAEGFSLPVLEACAAGVPTLASDIPAHRALLPAAYLFALDKPESLAALLEETLARRDDVVRAQAGLWQDYTAEKVAARVAQTFIPTPAITRGAKPRLALISPLPPVQSGLADYTKALLPHLRAKLRVDAIASDRAIPALMADGRYDAVLAVIGNDPYHIGTYELIRRWGGAVLCHDARLLGLVAGGFGLARAANLASAELGRAVTEDEIRLWSADETKREASFLGEMAAAARPLIFHSAKAAALVRARFGVAARHLPFATQRAFTPLPRAEARAALGLDGQMPVIASFGFITPGKGIAHALAAFAQLRQTRPCRLIFAGAATDHTPGFVRLAQELGIAGDVSFGADFLSEDMYRLHLAAANAALQLREGPGGNISGTLQDCINVGLPAVANADLAENLDAPPYVLRVGDALAPDEIAENLAHALDMERASPAARATYQAAHGMAAYAASLLQILGLDQSVSTMPS